MFQERKDRRHANRAFDHGEGVTRFRMRQKMISIGDDYWIEDADGRRVAIVKKAVIGPLRDRWRIKQEDGEDLRVVGNILDHEYTIERDGYKVAEVSKKWFRVRDTYGLDVGPDADPATVLAAAVAIDAMAHPGD
jgi:uncharacterized protein YxjI